MQGSRRAAAAAAIVVALAASASAQAAAPKLSGHPRTPVLTLGDRVELELTARNAGRGKTGKATIRFLLSADTRESKKDLLLPGKANVPPLPKGRSKTIGFRSKLPKAAKPGGYSVLACAGKSRCRSLAGTIGVGPRVERVNATLVPEGPSAARGMITPAGGRIDAQAADGTRYALIVPPGAVGSDVEVVMTPLGGAQNLPFEGLGAGVKLEPAGLDLDQPAKLLIQRDGLTISDGTAAFGSSDGRDLFLTPWTGVGPGESLGPGTIALPVGHFSGWGVVSLTEIQLGAQYARSAFQASDRISQEIREAIRQSDDGSFTDGEIPVDRLRDEIVKPLLEAAARDPIWLDDAIDAYLTLDRQVSLLVGERAIDDPAVEKLLAKALKRYSKALRDRCNSADFAALGQAMVHARQAEFLIPYLGFGPAAQALAEARDLLADCLRFELRMQSREDFQFEYTFGSTVAAVVPLAGEALDGAGPIGYIDASYVDGAGCSSSVPSTQGSTMAVDGGADLLKLAPSLPGKPAVTKPRVSFSVDPGTPQELIRVQCPDEPPQEVETAFWVTLWAGCTHRGPADSGFVRTIDGFEPTGTAGVLATRTYRGTYECPDDLAPVRVDETWEFAHTPAVG